MQKMKIANMGQMQTQHNRCRVTQSPANNRQPFLQSANERTGVGYEIVSGEGQQHCKTPLTRTRRDKETP